MSNKVNTKEKFIETASRLFELKGYNATGLNEILAESGAPKGSLYYHFPKGKEQLALESINLAGEKIKANLQKNLESIRNPVEAIIFNMEHLAQVIDNEQKTHDMSISLLALETYLTSEVLRGACEEVFMTLENMYSERLIEAGMNREKAYELGCVIGAMMEGGITLSLTKKNGNPLRLIAKQIPNLISI
ncbi:TetR/AcrR family transcriptional regulator [Clostridium beijerinckii]|uniref:TetR/AcrR family transcriptional repressor of lmrAB and yxaGH operons n=1 Tax=Clostridium beijerinckii TaxID=1520 RepID=A0AAE5H8X6_CLOBE|nr:TetR/AcrR family transcriptional regulator [Clostridium beijerinckii]ALB47282.1 Tet/AcrR family transcriptional regulator [Clostridium beijerinckii NRRL B-598]NSB16155.1 TetR/AcrR family transcriptional repressor of lmrAB and yxaGH operons [Clostridium beijerinckii]OOM28820.1 putative HTH-type transcriptional regulator YxaF [Clostridium beijerinckii]